MIRIKICFPIFILLLQLIILTGCGNDQLKQLAMGYIKITGQLNSGKIDVKQYISTINNIKPNDVPQDVANRFYYLKNVAINASQHLNKSWFDHGINIAKSIVKGYLGDFTAITDPILEGYNTFSLSKEWSAAEVRFYDSLLAAGVDGKWLKDTLLKYGLIKQKNK